jgi:hypothetical protein
MDGPIEDGLPEDALLGSHAIDDGEEYSPAERPAEPIANPILSSSLPKNADGVEPRGSQNNLFTNRPLDEDDFDDDIDDDDDDEGPEDFTTIDWMTFAEKDREKTSYIQQKFKQKPSLVGLLKLAYHNSQGWIALIIIGFTS